MTPEELTWAMVKRDLIMAGIGLAVAVPMWVAYAVVVWTLRRERKPLPRNRP